MYTLARPLFFLTLFLGGLSHAYDARFDSQSRSLRVPVVSVGQTRVSAELELVAEDPVRFRLNPPTPEAEPTGSTASFDAGAGLLRLNRVLAFGEFFTVTMPLATMGPDITFGLQPPSPNPYPLERGGNMRAVAPSYGVDSWLDAEGNLRRIGSHLEGSPRYGEAVSRQRDNGQTVKVPYMVHEPPGGEHTIAVVVLIAGGALTARLEGDADTGRLYSAGGNFLVRSAHLFAQLGFRAVTVDRPSDYQAFLNGPPIATSDKAQMDSYRVSSAHESDIAAVLHETNPDSLPVFLVGTSRGAVSAFAQSRIAAGIALSSPVTEGGGYPVGGLNGPATARIEYPTVPIHLLYHPQDGCTSTTPDATLELYQRLKQQGKDVTLLGLSGGFVDPAHPDPCGAFHYHGFLGIESAAVGYVAAWLHAVVKDPSPAYQ